MHFVVMVIYAFDSNYQTIIWEVKGLNWEGVDDVVKWGLNWQRR